MTATTRTESLALGSRARSALVILVAHLALWLAGCIKVTPQAPRPPSPLRTVSTVQVTFDYGGLLVSGMGSAKTEAEWLAIKTGEDPQYPRTWADLKSKWEEYYMTGLVSSSPVPVSRWSEGAPPPQGAALLKVTMSELQMGKYIPFATRNSLAKATGSWWLNEQMVEVSDTWSAVTPSLRNPSIFQHIRVIGRDSGARTGRFLREVRR